MRKFNFWFWDKAMEGTQVYLVDPNNIQSAISGVVSNVERSNKYRLIDGKPVRSDRVVSVTIKCTDGKEITVAKGKSPYQIMLK